jgi:hypothetical protein
VIINFFYKKILAAGSTNLRDLEKSALPENGWEKLIRHGQARAAVRLKKNLPYGVAGVL